MKKRILAILLVMMLFLATACGGTGQGTGSEDASGAASTATADGSDNPAESEDPLLEDPSSSAPNSQMPGTTSSGQSKPPTTSVVEEVETSSETDDLYKDIKGTTVRVISFEEPATIVKLQVKAFQKHYGCTVKMEIYSWADWQNRILEMVSAGNAPDLAICFDQNFLKYASTGVLQPIDSFIDPDAPLWDSNILNTYQWKGKTYCVNTNAFDGIVLHYNKNLLENAGLDGKNDPWEVYKRGEWTFEKFRDYAKQLTVTKNGKTDVWGYASWIDTVFMMAAGGTGIQVNANGSITNTIDKPAELAGIEMIRQLVHEDKSTSFEAQQQHNALFRAQKAAFLAERPSYAVADDSVNNGFEIGMVPLPKLDKNSKHYLPTITQGWGVPVGAKNPKGAMAYIYYSGVFSEANENTAYALESRRKIINDEHLARYNEIVDSIPKINSFINSVGNWQNKQWENLWLPVYVDNVSAANAAAKAKPVLQYEIDQTIKGK